jgi:hypothetical protein
MRGRYTQGPMHREASPDVESATASPTGRTRARRRLRLLAVLLNVGLFAIVNSAALTMPRRGAVSEHFVLRLRRIALLANTLLLLVAAVIVFLSALRDWRHAVLHGVALAVPPLLTVVALRRYPHG